MTRLNTNTMEQLPSDVKRPAYNLDETGCGIVHLGPGAFHRAHQAVYTDLAMAAGGNWRISAVSMRSRSLKEKLSPQHGLYCLVVLDEEPYIQLIGAIKNLYVLDEDRDQVMEQLCSPETHVITLTITEKGYCLDSQGKLDMDHPDIKHDLASPGAPVSAIGLLCETLRLRKQQRRGELTIISCDNLSENGTKLEQAVLEFALARDESLATWISDTICFPNTMVDSITPATDDALIEHTQKQTGLTDAWPIQREAFSQWVIEDKFSGPRPAWENVGVTFTDDVEIFETAKLRILNGTHSTLAYLGCLCGLETVYEAINAPGFESFLRRLLKQEIEPSITTENKLDTSAYSNDIVKRYHNRHIRHLLSQIAWDGSQKLPFRILNTIRDNLSAGRPIALLCVPVAAWIHFIAMQQQRNQKLTDPLADQLLALAKTHQRNGRALANAVMDLKSVFADLSDKQDFRSTVLTQYDKLSRLADDPVSCLNGL